MAREDHTGVGWWLMTHDRAGSALIGSVALAVVIVDASYVATDWHRRGSEFLLGFGLLAAAALLAKALRVGDARLARRNNLILGSLLVVSVIAALSLGSGATWGLMLGELAALGCLFAAVGLRAATRA
jgi:hypothetical protein